MKYKDNDHFVEELSKCIPGMKEELAKAWLPKGKEHEAGMLDDKGNKKGKDGAITHGDFHAVPVKSKEDPNIAKEYHFYHKGKSIGKHEVGKDGQVIPDDDSDKGPVMRFYGINSKENVHEHDYTEIQRKAMKHAYGTRKLYNDD